MSSALDMSLDDLIKTNKKSTGTGGSRGRASGSGPAPARRFPNRSANRSAPYSMGKPGVAPQMAWQNGGFGAQAMARPASIETGTKLYLSNLEYSVSNDDIQELFSEVGELKRHSIHYDRSGRSKGTAEVVFVRRADAAAAIKRYNNVQLDGKLMKIEMVGTNIVTPAPMSRVTNSILGNPYGILGSGRGRGAFPRQTRGRGVGGGSGGRGQRGRGRGEKVSAEDLDADLEKYHAEAMQIN